MSFFSFLLVLYLLLLWVFSPFFFGSCLVRNAGQKTA